jgi:hypothetical protein
MSTTTPHHPTKKYLAEIFYKHYGTDYVKLTNPLEGFVWDNDIHQWVYCKRNSMLNVIRSVLGSHLLDVYLMDTTTTITTTTDSTEYDPIDYDLVDSIRCDINSSRYLLGIFHEYLKISSCTTTTSGSYDPPYIYTHDQLTIRV